MPNDGPLEDGKMQAFNRRMEARNMAYRREMMTKPREWPPPEKTKKRWTSHGFECAVAMGTVAICGYIKLPADHPYYGLWHHDISLDVHYGLTFSCKAVDGWWIGWDYGHAGDWIGFSYAECGIEYEVPGKIWTVEDVTVEVEAAARELQRIQGERVAP